MKATILRIGALAAAAALACCLVGCSCSMGTGGSSGGDADEAAAPSGYFEEFAEMQSPDGVISASEKIKVSSDFNGEVSATYTYDMESADAAQAKTDADTYVAALTKDGFVVESTGEGTWSIAKDGESIGEMKLDADKQELEVKLEPPAKQ